MNSALIELRPVKGPVRDDEFLIAALPPELETLGKDSFSFPITDGYGTSVISGSFDCIPTISMDRVFVIRLMCPWHDGEFLVQGGEHGITFTRKVNDGLITFDLGF